MIIVIIILVLTLNEVAVLGPQVGGQSVVPHSTKRLFPRHMFLFICDQVYSKLMVPLQDIEL